MIFFCHTGISQNTYTNCDLGFQISKPNERWDFDTDLNAVKIIRTGQPPEEYFLGGVYVATTEYDHVLVAVFNDARLKRQSLNEWVDDLEKIAQYYNATTIKKEVALDEDWAIYAAKFSDMDGLGYSEQIIKIKNKKAYLIQSMGLDLNLRTEKQDKEFDYIFDSFKTFQTFPQILFGS
ncbi:MAG: hypothetical protein HZA84_09340 [Thaumarchaeota archaeon]|nr:hypothetical protein [Nitrososphaerota archaeon]